MVATVLTLLVVPALYAMWFRVRADEPVEASSIDPEPVDHSARQGVPLQIAA